MYFASFRTLKHDKREANHNIPQLLIKSTNALIDHDCIKLFNVEYG